MKNKMKDTKEREEPKENGISIRDKVFFATRGKFDEILYGTVVEITRIKRANGNKGIVCENKFKVYLENRIAPQNWITAISAPIREYNFEDIGKTVFLTAEEAEEKLFKKEDLEKQLRELGGF